jgi:hypothetical protein
MIKSLLITAFIGLVNFIVINIELQEKINSDTYSKYLVIFLSSLVGSIIGAAVTIWFKQKEFKLMASNLNLQKQLFEETKRNNNLKIKTELVKLEDLSRQYNLNLKRYDFQHLTKILDMDTSNNQKVEMLKEMALILHKYSPKVPDWVEDYYEYKEFIIRDIYDSKNFIKDALMKLLTDYPSVFINIHTDIQKVSSDISNINSQAAQLFMLSNEVHEDFVIDELSESLFQINEDFMDILNKMKEEFKELETMKSDYVKEQFNLRVGK